MTILTGDCLDIMATLDADSIDSIITDPPYGLAFMGKAWDHGVPGKEVWEAALRVAKPGAALLAFGGTRTYHRLACAIEDAGWQIRDCLMWLYGSGFPKSMANDKAIDKAAGAERPSIGKHPQPSSTLPRLAMGDGCQPSPDITAPATDAAKLWNGWGTALKPAWEPILLAFKPLAGTFAENAQSYGVAGLNIDACRIAASGPSPSIDRRAAGYKPNLDKAAESVARGEIRQRGDVAKRAEPRPSETLGRFPANLILDEEAGEMLDAQSGESVSRDRKRHNSGTPSVAKGADKPVVSSGPADSGGASRFFYCAKASRRERGEGNIHPTVKPLALMEYLCKLTSTPTGGIVLDPFAGSGTTRLAARNVGREFIGIEKNPDYVAIIEKRLAGESLALAAVESMALAA